MAAKFAAKPEQRARERERHFLGSCAGSLAILGAWLTFGFVAALILGDATAVAVAAATRGSSQLAV